jgi:arylsulfatase
LASSSAAATTPAPPYAFTGTVKEVIFDLKPVHLAAEKALREHASVQAVGHGAAG